MRQKVVPAAQCSTHPMDWHGAKVRWIREALVRGMAHCSVLKKKLLPANGPTGEEEGQGERTRNRKVMTWS